MALLSASDVKGVYLVGIDAASTEQDTLIDATIAAAESAIAAYLGYAFDTNGVQTLDSSSYDLYLGTTSAKRSLWVNAAPLTAISQIDEDGTVIDSGDYAIRGRARVYMTSSGSAWPNTGNEPTIRVQCTAGYSALDNDHPLARAIGLTVKSLWEGPRTQGRKSESKQGKSVSFDAPTAIPRVAQLLAEPYRVSL